MDKKRIVACDLDGTLAEYHGWKGVCHIGAVVESVKTAIKHVRDEGGEVWIFTARISDHGDIQSIRTISEWLKINGITVDGMTSEKLKKFTEFWDDRAIQVVKNKGVFVLDNDPFIDTCRAGEPPLFLPVQDECSIEQGALDVQEGGGHYKKYKIQPIEFCHANNIPSIEANVIKYTVRHRDKNGVEDIKKAIHTLKILAKLEYGEEL